MILGLGRRPRFVATVVLAFVLIVAFISIRHAHSISDAISYSTRPLWDTPEGPRQLLPHYYAEGIPFDQQHCARHGWAVRTTHPQVWDAVLFSTELDLLEIRLHELDAVVDKFFILESDHTFTGIPKPTVFHDNRQRFAAFSSKIVYTLFNGHPLNGGEKPFDVEAQQRTAMSSLIQEHISSTTTAPLVIFSDVDEIPSAHSIRLIKSCAAPSPLHLQMRGYLYSYEWPYGWTSWRAQIHEWGPGSFYRHSLATDLALADAGWHCSFCFRHLGEFAIKMQGYSHADRLKGDMSLLSPERIQKVICEGTDIFNMLPEAYSYKDMLSLMHPDALSSAVGLPLYLVQNNEKFKFLLPGGCIRES